MKRQIAVIGAGSWGTALAGLLAEKGWPVRLWGYEAELIAQLQQTHRNEIYLPGHDLSPALEFTNDLAEALDGAGVVVLAVPSHAFRSIALQLAPHLPRTAMVVCCTKGLEIGTGHLMGDILAESLPELSPGHIAFLSGPSFAKEVAERQPTAVVIAGTNRAATEIIQDIFRTPYFLTFTHDDPIGVQVGGAVKNVLAIAAGIVEGLGLGYNTRAALMTRGLYEMIKLGRALGADPLTFAGLAGIGDMILTCTGTLSRNRHVGIEIGQGKPLEIILRGMHMVAEGVGTAKAIHELRQQHDLTLPICTAVYDVLYRGTTPQQAVDALTMMELKAEFSTVG